MSLPDPATLDDGAVSIAQALPPAELVRHALQLDPKASGLEIATWAAHPRLNRADLTPAKAKALRAGVRADAAPPPPMPLPGVTFTNAAESAQTNERDHARPLAARMVDMFEDALRTGQAQELKRVVDVIKGILGPSALADLIKGEDASTADWGRLSSTQIACASYLCRVAEGKREDDDAWWDELFSYMPEAAKRPHPAHVPLPDGSPLPDGLVTGEGAAAIVSAPTPRRTFLETVIAENAARG